STCSTPTRTRACAWRGASGSPSSSCSPCCCPSSPRWTSWPPPRGGGAATAPPAPAPCPPPRHPPYPTLRRTDPTVALFGRKKHKDLTDEELLALDEDQDVAV